MATPTQIQTQTPSVRIAGPIPVRFYLNASFITKKKENARLVRLQWHQQYADRDFYAPVIKIDPELYERRTGIAILEIWREQRMWKSEERGIRAPEGATRTIIKLYKPKHPEKTVPKAIFVAVSYPLRDTAMGGYDNADLIIDDGVIWHDEAINKSRSGNHGNKLIMALSTKPIRIHWITVSNRGNRDEGIDIYDFDGVRTLPRYEKLETLKRWYGGELARMRDNLINEEFTALILEFHEARKTSARTNHVMEPKDAVELLWWTGSLAKTHWTEVYRVLKPCKVKTVRITNCGNRYEWETEVSP